jgi:hypothetical protein
MRARSLIAILSVIALTVASNSQASAGETSRSAIIGTSKYAFDYFPPCAHGLDVANIVSNAAELSALLGYSDAGVIALGAQIFGEVRRHGGWLSQQFSRLEGGSRSTCVAICVRPPAGSYVNHARLYIDGHTCSLNGSTEWGVDGWATNLQCGRGWSGVKQLNVSSEGACAVFANWKHDWTAEATLVLAYD